MILSRPARIALLTGIQNAPENAGRDILTFAGFCDDAELGDYIMNAFRSLGEESRRRALAVAHSIVNA